MWRHAPTVPVWLVIVLYVVAASGAPVWVHYSVHNVVNTTHVALAFFCGLNALIAFWEIALGTSGCCAIYISGGEPTRPRVGWEIRFIEETHRSLLRNSRCV